MCFAPQRHAPFRHGNFQKRSNTEVFCTFWLGNVLRTTTACTFSTSQLPKVVRREVLCTFWLRNVLRTTTACTFSTSQLPKVVRTWSALYILTSRCASHHNGAHFSHISTSKSSPNVMCFVHFDFEMCFVPQRRALFRHLNSQKWCEHGCALCILTWKCASRHNGLHFFISHLASWLRTRRFSEPTFRPSGATNQLKNSASRLSYLFAHLDLLSSETFSFFLFPSLLFICPYCRKFDF